MSAKSGENTTIIFFISSQRHEKFCRMLTNLVHLQLGNYNFGREINSPLYQGEQELSTVSD